MSSFGYSNVAAVSSVPIFLIARKIFAVVFLICHIISVCALFNFAIYTFTAFTWRYLDYCGITSAVSPLPAPTLPFVFFSAFIALLIGILVIVRHKDNIIHMVRNRMSRKATPVMCVETGIIYASLCEAEKGTGVYRRGIKKACESGDACMGKHWEYAL